MKIAYLLGLTLLVGCGHPPTPEEPGDMPGMPGMKASEMPASNPAEDPGDMPGMPGMKASPVTAPGAGIVPSETAARIMGLSIAPVRSGIGKVPRRAPASVSFDPTASVRVSSQSGGQIRELSVPAPGEIVSRGQILARIYDPALQAVLEEVRIARTLSEPWPAAAASRARASGVPDEDVRAVLNGGDVPDTFVIRSPIRGIVVARPLAEGMWMAPGSLLVSLVDPDVVLVDLVVDGAPPLSGTIVHLRDTDGTLVGTASVTGTLPEATVAGVRVRVHPDSPIRPGRPLLAEWTEETATSLWIPTSALVDTGTRKVVFVHTEEGFFSRPVETGVHAGEEIEVTSGLQAGDSVANSAAFLLDSETQIGAMRHSGHGQ